MMDPKFIRRLVRIMVDSGVTELELDDAGDGVRLRLKRGVDAPAGGAPVVHLMPGAAGPAPVAAPGAVPAAATAPEAGGPPPGTLEILSPMVGTFYRAASPEASNFVAVGDRVDDESVVCIIEAMKVMNEIKAEMSGELTEVLVETGEPVEFGQPLFLIKKG